MGSPHLFNYAIVSRLVCSLPFSSCFFLCFPIFLFQVARSIGTWSLQVLAVPSQGTEGHGSAGRPERGGGCQEEEENQGDLVEAREGTGGCPAHDG